MRRLRRLGSALCAGALLLAAGCAPNAPQDFLKPEGPIARRIDNLFKPVFWVAVGVFAIVEGLLVVAILRFRARRRERELPVQVHGNTPLEIGWTLAPALLLAVIAVPTVATIFSVSEVPRGREVLTVEVTGRQWWWDYNYKDLGFRTANELHIPVGRPVLLLLRSADVIHSYWVPKLAGKQDVIPGRVNHLTLRAEKPGRYLGQCAEFCAISHANMRLEVVAQEEADFQRWVAEQRRPAASPTDPLAARGERLFMTGKCVNCHAIRGTPAAATVAPDLTHFASRATFGGATFANNPENLRRWLRDPPAMKPGARMPDYGLREDEIEALVAYLQTLR